MGMTTTNPSHRDVAAAAQRLGHPLTDAQVESLATYLDQLIKWNRKMNLVGRSTWRDVFDTLVVDSLHLAGFLAGLDLPDSPLTLDLGAGAGLPGIPLRALWQAGDYHLVEVREKRSLFMRSVLGKLRLPGTAVYHGKAEDVLESLGAPTADLILSRAFMPWEKLLDFTRPMLPVGGVIVILSNDTPPAGNALPQGWELTVSASYKAAKDTRHFWALQRTV